MRTLFIMHYLKWENFVNNGLQSAPINRRFFNIIHKMVQILQQEFVCRFTESTREDTETREPKHKD